MIAMRDSNCYYLGLIPEDWSVVPLKRYFHISKRIAGESGHDVLSITQKGLKVKDITSGEGQLAADYSGYQLVEPGDFAMNHMDLLTGWIDCSDKYGVTSPDYRVFRIDKPEFNKRYFLYFFQTCYSARIFYGFGKGISNKGRWRLPADQFRNMLIPVPDIPTQNRIANYLDEKTEEIDKAIEAAEASIEEYEAYKKSVIFRAVTKGLDSSVPMKDSGIEWVGQVPSSWTRRRFKEMYAIFSESGHEKEELLSVYLNKGVIRYSDSDGSQVHKPSSSLEKYQLVTPGCFVMNNQQAWRGSVGVSPYRGIVSPAYHVFRPKEGEMFLPEYMNSLFKYAMVPMFDICSRGVGTIQRCIAVAQFQNDCFFYLPTVEEQRCIVNHVERVSTEIERAVEAKRSIIESLRTYKKSLIYEVVTGKREI